MFRVAEGLVGPGHIGTPARERVPYQTGTLGTDCQSPISDGKRILFWSWRTGNPELVLVTPDGMGNTQLTDNLSWDVFPCWSPDGKKIAFDSDRMSSFDIWVMEAPK